MARLEAEAEQMRALFAGLRARSVASTLAMLAPRADPFEHHHHEDGEEDEMGSEAARGRGRRHGRDEAETRRPLLRRAATSTELDELDSSVHTEEGSQGGHDKRGGSHKRRSWMNEMGWEGQRAAQRVYSQLFGKLQEIQERQMQQLQIHSAQIERLHGNRASAHRDGTARRPPLLRRLLGCCAYASSRRGSTTREEVIEARHATVTAEQPAHDIVAADASVAAPPTLTLLDNPALSALFETPHVTPQSSADLLCEAASSPNRLSSQRDGMAVTRAPSDEPSPSPSPSP